MHILFRNESSFALINHKKMSENLTREVLQVELENLNFLSECPNLYLANHFSDLRARVDIEVATKQQTNPEKKEELTEIWQKMIAKIDFYETKYTSIHKKRKTEQTTTTKRLEEIKTMLIDHDSNIDLEAIKKEIYNEENNILKHLFENQTIALVQSEDQICQQNNSNDSDWTDDEELISLKLIILNDEFLNHKAINLTYKHAFLLIII